MQMFLMDRFREQARSTGFGVMSDFSISKQQTRHLAGFAVSA
ncbi:hypothetical protein [Pseudomonas sp. S2_A05]